MFIDDHNGYRVVRTKTSRCACYIVSRAGKHVLIDTSVPAERVKLEKSLRESGVEKLDAIFLTHSHSDHTANAQYFGDLFGCPVFIDERGVAPVKEGRCVLPKGTRPLGKIIIFLEHALPFLKIESFEPCPGVQPYTRETAGLYLGEFTEMLKTPGHTDDSVSFIIGGRVALVGDCVFNILGNKYPPFADDVTLLEKSWALLLKTPAIWFCPAHGQPVHRREFTETAQKELKQKGFQACGSA